MKKGLLLLGTFVTLAGVSNAQKLALYEEFSGENCGPCAAANPALMTLLDANPSKVLLLKYQSPIPSAGPIYGQNTADVQNRMTYYSVPFAPYGRSNGAVLGTGQNAGHVSFCTQASIDAAAAETTPFTLTFGTPTYTGNDFSVQVTVTATTAAAYANAKLRFALTEDLEFATPPGTNGETSFHHVMRKMYPTPDGQAIQASFTANQTQVFTITGTIPAYTSSENPRMFVAWIQNDADKVVLQAKKSVNLPPAVNAIASNSISVTDKVKCAATYSFAPVVNIKNTGSAALTSAQIHYKLDNGAYTVHNWTGNLAAGASTNVTLPGIAVNTPGAHVITDSVAMPNNVADAGASNNVNATAVYLLNESTEVLPQSNDFEAAAPMWVELAGTSGAPIYKINLAGKGYNSSNNLAVFPCYNIAPNGTGFITLPKSDMSAAQKALDFYVAYAQYQNENDKLEVVYSTDCGVSWTSVWNKAGSSLSTAPATTSSFVPSSNAQWRKESIDVSSVPQGARLAFRATSAYGNNMFLDNIQLRAGAPTAINDVIAAGSISTYPNPVSNELNIEMNMTKASSVTFSVVNALGQEVLKNAAQNFGTGKQTATVDVSSLAAGMYYLNIVTAEGTTQQKFSKQ